MNRYPAVIRRYIASIIDVAVTVGLIAICFAAVPIEYRLWVFVIVLPMYEPLLVSRACTVGQLLMKIRVKDSRENRRISYLRALVRYSMKFLLGFISLVTIPASRDRRAIHDMSADSLVVFVDAEYVPVKDQAVDDQPLTADEEKQRWESKDGKWGWK